MNTIIVKWCKLLDSFFGPRAYSDFWSEVVYVKAGIHKVKLEVGIRFTYRTKRQHSADMFFIARCTNELDLAMLEVPKGHIWISENKQHLIDEVEDKLFTKFYLADVDL